MKVPQIIKIAKAGSVYGLSEAWIINDCLAGLAWVHYNILMRHPFLTWGENLAVAVQNVVLVLMFWNLSPQLSKLTRATGTIVLVISSALVLTFGLPAMLLSALGFCPIILSNVSKLPQVMMNNQQKHTGTMAVIPVLLGMAGTVVRTLTSVVQTPDDYLSILNPLLAAILYGVLIGQFFAYYAKSKELEEAAKKDDKKKS